MSEQAFPVNPDLGGGFNPGMSLLDYFAAKAMQAELSSYEGDSPADPGDYYYIAERAYKMAEAMMKHRKNFNKPGTL